jgi:hypothetical protein
MISLIEQAGALIARQFNRLFVERAEWLTGKSGTGCRAARTLTFPPGCRFVEAIYVARPAFQRRTLDSMSKSRAAQMPIPNSAAGCSPTLE